jgi:hypothetical protein
MIQEILLYAGVGVLIAGLARLAYVGIQHRALKPDHIIDMREVQNAKQQDILLDLQEVAVDAADEQAEDNK